MLHRRLLVGLIIKGKGMDRDVMIQYCGPYLIQTTEAVMMGQTVESFNIAVDRSTLLEEENPVNVYQQEG